VVRSKGRDVACDVKGWAANELNGMVAAWNLSKDSIEK
jgi:hypothetical protein